MKIRKQVEESFMKYDKRSNNFSCHVPGAVFYVYNRAKFMDPHESPANSSTITCSTKQFVPLIPDPLLNNVPTNRREATIHIPTNVYDMSENIQNTAKWTSSLDAVFIDNADVDPTTNWQYFCSAMGFFRIYPGIMWNIQTDDTGPGSPVDFFDCRSRSWFLQAASYPRDVVVIVDMSGSMKGRRSLIANHTITEILNTLTDNDYFRVVFFASEIDEILTNQSRLLQATYKNKERMIRDLQLRLVPSSMANYTRALIYAFDLLKNATMNNSSSTGCQQMVMVVSDGAPHSFPELFQILNPERNVRVFTYLVGQAVEEIAAVREMACTNRGYCVQISALADVKENVQRHLDVIARTNAIARDNMVVWSHISNSQMNPRISLTAHSHGSASGMAGHVSSDYSSGANNPGAFEGMSTTPFPVYAVRRNNASLDGEDGYNFNMSMWNMTNMTVPYGEIPSPEQDVPTVVRGIRNVDVELFVSVAMPAYGVGINDTATLLGVAGVDVPVSDFKRLAPVWKMGVNGYAFMVTNNGFIIFHPKHTPTLGDSLKAFYQNVDIADVEVPESLLVNDSFHPYPDFTLSLRLDLINHVEGQQEMTVMHVPDQFNHFKRQRMKYFYVGVQKTPYSLGVAFPWQSEAKMSEPIPQINIPDSVKLDELSTADLNVFSVNFSQGCDAIVASGGDGVMLSPYLFCKFDSETKRAYQINPLCALHAILTNAALRKSLECDETFLKNVLTDAKATAHIPQKWQALWSSNEAIKTGFGVEQVFLYQFSGLIRFFNDTKPLNEHFVNDTRDGTQSALYKTTEMLAQWNKQILYVEPPRHSMVKVLSTMNSTARITATTAISNGENPNIIYGVVGVQFDLQKLSDKFEDITATCTPSDDMKKCAVCSEPDMDCYVVTSAGIILMSNNNRTNEAGERLGTVDCALMDSLINGSVFYNQTLYDFQGVCFAPVSPSNKNAASRFLAPFKWCFVCVMHFVWQISIFAGQFLLHSLWTAASTVYTQVSPNLASMGYQSDAHSQASQHSAGADEKDGPPFPSTPLPSEMFSPDGNDGEDTDVLNPEKHLEYLNKIHGCIHEPSEKRSSCIGNWLKQPCHTDPTKINECRAICRALRQFPRSLWAGFDACRTYRLHCPVAHTGLTSFKDSMSTTGDNNANVNYINENMKTPVIEGTREGTVQCNPHCIRRWWAQSVPDTNLILIVLHQQSGGTCQCDCSTKHYSSEGRKLEGSNSSRSILPEPPRNTPPWGCKHVSPSENITDCSNQNSAARLQYNIPIFLFLCVLSVHSLFWAAT